MIAAIYARKSTEQKTGVVRSVLMAILLAVATVSTAEAADEKDMSYEDYQGAIAQINGYFMKLYTAVGVRVRQTVILARCGYKKEADDLDAGTEVIVKTILDRLAQEGIEKRKLPTFAALVLVRESAQSMFTGYRLGFKESLDITSDHLAARDYEALCKSSLREARKQLKEGEK